MIGVMTQATHMVQQLLLYLTNNSKKLMRCGRSNMLYK